MKEFNLEVDLKKTLISKLSHGFFFLGSNSYDEEKPRLMSIKKVKKNNLP